LPARTPTTSPAQAGGALGWASPLTCVLHGGGARCPPGGGQLVSADRFGPHTCMRVGHRHHRHRDRETESQVCKGTGNHPGVLGLGLGVVIKGQLPEDHCGVSAHDASRYFEHQSVPLPLCPLPGPHRATVPPTNFFQRWEGSSNARLEFAQHPLALHSFRLRFRARGAVKDASMCPKEYSGALSPGPHPTPVLHCTLRPQPFPPSDCARRRVVFFLWEWRNPRLWSTTLKPANPFWLCTVCDFFVPFFLGASRRNDKNSMNPEFPPHS